MSNEETRCVLKTPTLKPCICVNWLNFGEFGQHPKGSSGGAIGDHVTAEAETAWLSATLVA
jgi:hypothetical protein